MRSLGAEEVMPCWYYDKKELRTCTPSVRDGIDPDVESRYRKEGARFIMDTGAKMGLKHYETLATGMVYFHRFYMLHSFKQFPRFVTACCCLFLAGKVEETPKKCKDIIKAARSLLTDQQFAQFGEDPKEEVMTLERILLQTIKFDLQVEHPYKFLLKYCKSLKGDREKLEAMLQMAWTFVNDSLFTTLCLQWEPEIIAIALMYLAGKLSKFEVTDWASRQPKHQRWWDMFVEDISMELLEDVCHQVLDLYSNSSNSTESPPPTPPTSAAARAATNEVQSLGGGAPIGQPHPSAARKHKLPSPSVAPKSMTGADGSKQHILADHQLPPLPQPITTVSHHGHPQAIQALGDVVPSHAPPPPPTTVVPSPALPPGYKYGGQPTLPMDTYGAPPPPQYRIASVNSGYSHTAFPPPDVADGAPPGQYGQPPAIPPTSAPPPSFLPGYDVSSYPPGYNPPPLPTGHQVAPMPPPPPPYSGQYLNDSHYNSGIQQPPPPPPPPQMHQAGQYQHPPPQPPHFPQPPPNYPPHLGQPGHFSSPAGYMDGSQARLPPPPPSLQDHMGQIHSQNITAIRITERQGTRQNWGV